MINFGQVPLSVTSLSITQAEGTGFSLPAPGGFIIPAQSTANLAVAFTPTTIGAKGGTLVINSNDPATPVLNVALSGIAADSTPPTVVLQNPIGGETVAAGAAFQVRFTATDSGGLGLFTVFLSTNGGATFPLTLGSGPTLPGQNAFNATAPAGISTNQAVVRVQVRDTANNIGQGTSGVFTIGTAPSIINPKLNKKFRTAAAGSNIQAGAVLVVGTETWPLALSGSNWVVGKQDRSSLNRRLKDAFDTGQNVTIRLRNPGGLESVPVALVVQP